jgi:hypothetical protein
LRDTPATAAFLRLLATLVARENVASAGADEGQQA